jgi:hypothetical protein
MSDHLKEILVLGNQKLFSLGQFILPVAMPTQTKFGGNHVVRRFVNLQSAKEGQVGSRLTEVKRAESYRPVSVNRSGRAWRWGHRQNYPDRDKGRGKLSCITDT